MANDNTSPADGDRLSVYANKRFAGRFKRTVSLSEDADADKVEVH
ncbi:MAG: hypothetical protein ACRERX_06235 [Pseudomonas sp.]